MRRTSALFLVAGLLVAVAAAAEERPSPKFDGDWNTTLICLNDEKSGARGYKFFFIAAVKDGVFLGKYGNEGEPGSMTLTGPILADGSSLLDAKGLVGNSENASNRGARGTTYSWQVKAQFEAEKGTGKRLNGRRCEVEFFKR
ncbi:MAG: hypothetical protein M3167_06640 [Acidobacteriota bacterium]|nr:hypothetical protein [Acidobacteriota bacterium]